VPSITKLCFRVKKLKILLVHNAYQHKGGEDSVMEAEFALLGDHGHSVELFTRHNDALTHMPKVVAAAQTMWSVKSGHAFEKALRSFQPDVVHVHNTFPLISPSIYWVAERMSVPVVQTLHNFRLMCPQAMFLRDGRVCEDCLGKLPWRGAVRGCYRDSIVQSTVLASMVSMHRAIGTWKNKVTRYIALNDFCRDKFIIGGLPGERIVVKPNFVDSKSPTIKGVRSDFLFVGRLSPEKGIDVLLSAANAIDGVTVRFAGTGPQSEHLQGFSCVHALGQLSKNEVNAEMSRACAVIVPSIWFETFGMVAVESFANGTPVIASRIGVLPNLIIDGKTGLLFEPGNVLDLVEKMKWAQQHPHQMAEMGRNARSLFEAEYSAERNYAQLMTIYEDAIQDLKNRSRK